MLLTVTQLGANTDNKYCAILLANGILGGVRIADDTLLVCVTEQRSKAEMDKFVEIVSNI